MKFKKGVTVKFIKPEIVLAINVANQVYENLVSPEGVTITCVTDGKHKGHQHSLGYAVDIRTRSHGSEQWLNSLKEKIAEEIRLRLTDEYNVIVESTHIHIEFDIREA